MPKAAMKVPSAPSAPSPTVAAQPIAPAPESEKPIHRIQVGIARGSIWKSGSPEKPVYTLTLDRVVTDRARNEHVTQVFESSDVRQLAKVTKECAAWIEWQERYFADRNSPQR
jgi:hypothetical protein